ncbi:MAG: PKD domain-containing protein [Candidatus Binataceae bacterium]
MNKPIAALAVLLAVAMPCGAQQAEPATSPTPSHSLTNLAAPLSLSLFVYPNYGSAPLTVGAYADLVDPLDAEVVSFYWSFGDGNVSTLPAPMEVMNTYTTDGSYLVMLRVVMADGRSATAFSSVTVHSAPR